VKKPPPGKRPLKTLERVLSKAGLGSRTDARKWIGAGRVKVNGTLVQTPDHWVDLARDRVTLDDKLVEERENIYLLLYKPTGYITTFQVPVGRLDQDTSGLLLLTSDTHFAERVTNPDYKVPKTYLVKASTLLSDQQLEQLRQGVVLSDGPTQPAQVQRVRDAAKYSFIEITLHEGRNRQVRRMLEAVGSRVLKLVRVQIGSLRIGDLPIGRYRELTASEVASLAAGIGRKTGPGTGSQRARAVR